MEELHDGDLDRVVGGGEMVLMAGLSTFLPMLFRALGSWLFPPK